MNSQPFFTPVPPFAPETGPSPEEELRQERRDARQMRRRQQRRSRLGLWTTIGISVLLLALIGFFYLQIENGMTRDTLYPTISGLQCDSMEQTGYHIHVHLSIYINGKPLTIPVGIGIAPDGSCFYWMHTHTDDGILHIEEPKEMDNLALDDFLTLWQQGFPTLNYPPQMTLSSGWQIWVNGTPFNGVVTSPLHTEVKFHSHDAITLEYGSPNPLPDKFFAFPANLPQ